MSPEPMPADAAMTARSASKRPLRVAERMRQLLAQRLAGREPFDPALERTRVTVSEVRVSADLRHATVYLTELGRPLSRETQQALERLAGRLGGWLAREMRLKYAPRLRFVADERFDAADRIARLLEAERRRSGGDPERGGRP